MRVSAHHAWLLLLALVATTGGAGAAVASAPVRLSATGPTDVDGTSATAVFRVADREIRQVRYRDKHDLVYSFTLRNRGSLPVTVTGLAPLDRAPRLFRYLRLEGPGTTTRFDVPAGGSVPARLVLRMEACESLSARAGSFATEMAVRTTRAALVDDVVTVTLPEEVHTGSPREAFCPESTAGSRPPG
jgi:hypothetical protein